MTEKARLRREFRTIRRDHVRALPDSLRALILNRPPAPVTAMIPQGSIIGLYHSVGDEAPASGWARWFSENGHVVALPAFDDRNSPMVFRIWEDPYDEDLLEPSPWGGALQPAATARQVVPATVIVPLVAFSPDGARLGQGGGHYDRWLAAHGEALAIGLAWDVQRADTLPTQPHDRALAAIVTPTRVYETSQG